MFQSIKWNQPVLMNLGRGGGVERIHKVGFTYLRPGFSGKRAPEYTV